MNGNWKKILSNIGTVPKSKRKITEWGKIDIPSIYVHDWSLSGLFNKKWSLVGRLNWSEFTQFVLEGFALLNLYLSVFWGSFIVFLPLIWFCTFHFLSLFDLLPLITDLVSSNLCYTMLYQLYFSAESSEAIHSHPSYCHMFRY